MKSDSAYFSYRHNINRADNDIFNRSSFTKRNPETEKSDKKFDAAGEKLNVPAFLI